MTDKTAEAWIVTSRFPRMANGNRSPNTTRDVFGHLDSTNDYADRLRFSGYEDVLIVPLFRDVPSERVSGE